MENTWFQDGATAHTANAVMEEVSWYCHLSQWRHCLMFPWPQCLLIFFLLGYLKSKMYANKPHTLEEMSEAVREVIGTIDQH